MKIGRGLKEETLETRLEEIFAAVTIVLELKSSSPMVKRKAQSQSLELRRHSSKSFLLALVELLLLLPPFRTAKRPLSLLTGKVDKAAWQVAPHCSTSP